MEVGPLVVVILAGVVTALLVTYIVVRKWAQSAYQALLRTPQQCSCDIDQFVGDKNPPNCTKVVLAHKFRLGARVPSLEPIPLETYASPYLPGLRVSVRQGTSNDSSNSKRSTRDDVQPLENLFPKDASNNLPIVIGTIRMGFGHHRIAYSAASWALKQSNRQVIFHDLLSIDSEEADLIKSTDELYSRFSRYASEMGGMVEKLWGSAMLSGDSNALRIAALTAMQLQPLLLAYPKNIPIITTHQLVALTASAVGFTNVINLVVDNHPQWFLTVPNTKNLCQGPVNYQSFLRMGVPPDQLGWAGHWCPAELVTNIDTDCKARIQRRQGNKPLRLLIPVGGAGAQRKHIIGFVRAMTELVKQNRVQLFLNAGDHSHMKEAFVEVLKECAVEYETVTTLEGVQALQQKLLSTTAEPSKGITLFTFAEYFPAVAMTDIMIRVVDVLCCKPSELAFYCVPKLHLRRVGDHEADSAKRASELHDGTEEARELSDAIEYVDLFLNTPNYLISMNKAIMKNNSNGIYDGCKFAVQLACGEVELE